MIIEIPTEIRTEYPPNTSVEPYNCNSTSVSKSILGYVVISEIINPLNAELNPIRHLLALVGARHIVHVSRIRVNI